MEKVILAEINRVREIMGLVVEQDSKEIRSIDGRRYEVTSTVLPPYQSGKWSATFKPGKYSGGDLQGSVDGDIAELAKYLNQDALKNQKLVVSVSAGSSKTPITPGGAVAQTLTSAGVEPTNAGLAELRGKTAIELVKNGLRGQIPEDIFNNIEFVVDLSQIEKGTEFVSGTDDPNDSKYEPYQFLSATAFATATQETLAELPDICNTSIKGSGAQGERKNKGSESGGSLPFAAYPENGGLGKEIDLGLETEGLITFNFTAYHIPDMFQITYGNQTYTSSGPGGEGFVSNDFKTCEEGSSCHDRYMRKIDNLKRKLGKGSDKVEKIAGRTKILTRSFVNMLIGEHGYTDEDFINGNRIDREWILDFWDRFSPADKSTLGKLFTGKKTMKYNSNFTDGWSRYDSPGTAGRGAKQIKGKDVWKKINDIWIDLDDAYENVDKDVSKTSGKLEKEIQTLERDLKELMATGNPGEYSKKMTRELLKLGYPNGVIGTNGSITFDKVIGEQFMYLQVFAPLDKTVWGASISCKDKSMPV